VDSEPVHLAAFNDVLAERGMHIDSSDYARHYLSLDDAGVFRAVHLREGLSLPEEEIGALVSAKSPRFLSRFGESFRAFPGAASLVLRRAARGPVGIVSGSLEQEIAFALRKLGVENAVSFVISAERAPASKPDPAPYRRALEELRTLGHEGHRAVAVEDSLGGVASAKQAGVRCIAVTHSCSREALIAGGADACVAELEALTDAVLDGTA
jgi:beta-phosphoglucomutase-like phosphatase (HAD superfamily)